MPAKNKPIKTESRNPKVRTKFRKARLNKDKTQREVALELNLKESYVRLIENGHTNPSLKRMLVFEKYFAIPAKELFEDLFAI